MSPETVESQVELSHHGFELSVALLLQFVDLVVLFLECAAGPRNAARFAAVLAGDVVARKKPAPDIYNLALQRLGCSPAEALVIEDSRNGLQAATAAGLRSVITVSSYTRAENFDEAALVVSDFGEPGGRIEVLANRSPARPEGWVRLADLAACLEHRTGACP